MFNQFRDLPREVLTNPNEAFAKLLPAVLLGAVVLISLDAVVCRIRPSGAVARKKWNRWYKLVYLASTLSVAVLGATAFYPVISSGGLSGWLLLGHVIAAGAFLFALPLLAITWCDANRWFARPASGRDSPPPRFFWFPRAMFWIILASGVAVSLTMLLSMLPLFGTDTMHVLLGIHRYSGLLLVVAMMLHVYSVLLQRAGLR